MENEVLVGPGEDGGGRAREGEGEGARPGRGVGAGEAREDWVGKHRVEDGLVREDVAAGGDVVLAVGHVPVGRGVVPAVLEAVRAEGAAAADARAGQRGACVEVKECLRSRGER